MSKREEFVKLPPYVDFREPPSTVLFRCTCGFEDHASVADVEQQKATHIPCLKCGGVAVKMRA